MISVFLLVRRIGVLSSLWRTSTKQQQRNVKNRLEFIGRTIVRGFSPWCQWFSSVERWFLDRRRVVVCKSENRSNEFWFEEFVALLLYFGLVFVFLHFVQSRRRFALEKFIAMNERTVVRLVADRILNEEEKDFRRSELFSWSNRRTICFLLENFLGDGTRSSWTVFVSFCLICRRMSRNSFLKANVERWKSCSRRLVVQTWDRCSIETNRRSSSDENRSSTMFRDRTDSRWEFRRDFQLFSVRRRAKKTTKIFRGKFLGADFSSNESRLSSWNFSSESTTRNDSNSFRTEF